MAQRFGIRAGAPILVLSGDTVALMTPVLSDARQYAATVSMTVLSVLLLAKAGRYRTPLHLSVLDDLPAIVGRLVVAASVIATAVALRSGPEPVGAFLRNCAMVAVLLIGGRVMTTRLIASSRERGSGLRRTLIVGGGTLTAEIADVLDNNAAYGLAVVGYVDDNSDRAVPDLIPWLGRLSDMDFVVRDAGVEALVVTPDAGAECALPNLLRAPGCLACEVYAVPRLYHLHACPAPVDRIGSVPVVRILRPNLSGPWTAVRRVGEATVSALVLAAATPFVAALLVASRVKRGRASPGILAQLWSVVRGTMSLVGPSLERADHVAGVSAKYECYRLRHRARAGLTGLAQVSGRNGPVSTHERALYDNYYIEYWSLWLDIKIVVIALTQAVAR